MKKRFILVLVTVVIIISSCRTGATTNDYFEILRNDDLTYRYELRSIKGKVLAESDMVLVPPKITELGDGIVRVELSQGSNALLIEYYDIEQGAKLQQYLTSGYYSDIYENEKLLISFYDIVDGKTVLAINDVFKGECIHIIERGFLSPTNPGPVIEFKSVKEIYVEYYVIIGASRDEYIYEGQGALEIISEIIATT